MSYMVHQWWLTFEISHPNYLGFCRNKWQQIDSSISGKMKHKADSHIVNLVSLDSHKLWLIAGVNSWCVVIIWAHPYDIFIFIYNEESTFWVIWVINYWYNFWNTGFSLSPPILTFLITPQREWTAVNVSLCHLHPSLLCSFSWWGAEVKDATRLWTINKLSLYVFFRTIYTGAGARR